MFKVKKYFLFVLLFYLLTMTWTLKAELMDNIKFAEVKNIYNYLMNEINIPVNYEIEHVDIQKGSFTKKNSREAVVSFYDTKASHAEGWTKIWLLKYEKNEWRKEKEIISVDHAGFQVLDIDNDGKNEVFITYSGGNQGAFNLYGKLISFNQGKENVLYSYQGLDHTGSAAVIWVEEKTLKEDEAIKLLDKYQVEFTDINGDRYLDIIQYNINKSYEMDSKIKDIIENITIIETYYLYDNGRYKENEVKQIY